MVFLFMYAVVILLSFHRNPLTEQDHRLDVLEIPILCYICGLVVEEFVQVGCFYVQTPRVRYYGLG